MNRYSLASPWGHHLTDTIHEWQQERVNELYSMNRWKVATAVHDLRLYAEWYQVPYRSGSIFSYLYAAEVIELCPPDHSAAEWVDLTNPPFLPIWVCDGSGKYRLVSTLEELEQELARQPQCYGSTPKGPWYGSFADPWPYPWEPGKGVFTPFPKSPGGDSPPWGDGTVYATRALTYPKGEWGRAPWELFQLRGRAEDTQLLDARDVVVCRQYPSDAALYTPTNRWFIDEHGHNFCAQYYEQGDVRGLGFELRAPLMSRDDPVAPPYLHGQSEDSASKSSRVRYAHRETFLSLLNKAIQDFRSVKKRDPGREEIAASPVWPEVMKDWMLKRHFAYHKIRLKAYLKALPWS